MAQQKNIEYTGEELKDHIISHAIRLINRYGFEHLTMAKICMAANCTKGMVLSCFDNLRTVLEASLAASFDHFIQNITLQLKYPEKNRDPAMEIWHQMVIYTINYPDHANALAQYLNSAYIFRIDYLRDRLNRVLDSAYDRIGKDLSIRKGQNIKFVISLYLYRSANHFVSHVYRATANTSELEQNYFSKYVAPDITKKLSLPIS